MTEKLEKRTSLGWMLMGLLGLQLAIAAPMSWVLSSYFGINVPASLMFFGTDGWCNAATEGVGSHCFGDFNERFMIDPSQPSPWPNNLELSPIGPLVTEAANILAFFLPSRLVLFLFILMYCACLLAPAVWAARGRSWPLGFLIVGIAGIATYPFAATMDRLNSIALTVPLTLAFLIALSVGNSRGVFFSVLALSVIKPQFMVLYVVLVAHRQMRAAIGGVLVSATSCVALVVGAGGGDIRRISEWFAAATSYGGGLSVQNATSFTPINASLSRVIYIASATAESIQQVLFGSHLPIWATAHSSLALIQGSAFLLAIAILALWGRRIPAVALGIAALVVSTLVLGEYVAAYYLVFALPVCALFLRRTATREPPGSFELSGEIDQWSADHEHRTWMQWMALVATTLSCSLLVVPLMSMGELGFLQDRFHRVGPIMQNLATTSWMAFLVIACGVALRSVLGRDALTSPAEATRPSQELSGHLEEQR